MSTQLPRALLAVRYYEAAQEYLRKLTQEHFMEAVSQVTQRKITLESFDLIQGHWPTFQHFNELLVQYERKGRTRLGQVVPDSMVVIYDQPIKAEGSYDVPLQPVSPFWVLEYDSKGNRRKDYEENMYKYEHELKVPYYLLFVPEEQELTLYRHSGRKYVSVKPNKADRYTIPPLETELGLVDGWVHFWFRGELLPLPVEMQRNVEQLRRQLKEEKRRSQQERKARLAAEQEVAQLRERLESKQEPRGS
jgi:hypothetical protein